MAKYRITSPDGGTYEVTAPDGASESEVLEYAKNNFKKPLTQIDVNRPQGAAAGMSGPEKFFAGVGKGMTDIGQGIGQMVGLQDRADVAEKRGLDADLSKTGAGKAGEIVGQVATTIPSMFIPGVNTVLGGGLVGAGIGLAQPSQSTTETLSNVSMGGAGGSLGVLAGRAIPKAIQSFVAPFTRSGSERVGGQVLREFAGGQADDVIRSAQSPATLVPGSNPTLAEVAQNPGISTMQQALRAVSPNANTALGQRASENLMARTGALRQIAGTADDLSMAENTRSVLTKMFYNAAENSKIPVTVRDRAISEIMERPSMQQAWTQAEKMARESGIQSVTSKGELTGGALHFLKMSLDDQIGAAKQAGRSTESRFLMETKNALQGWMEKNIPDYRLARTTYADLSKPINEMEVGKLLLSKLEPALMEGSKTPTRETAATFANAVKDAPRTIKSATGMQFNSLDDVMRPESANTVRGVVQDLQRKATSEDMARTIGSNTAQNLASQQLMRNILGPVGLPQSWAESVISQSMARPVQFAMKGAEGRIQDVLTRAALDPVFAAQIMGRAAPVNPGLLGRTYMNMLAPSVSGGLLAAQSSK
jgi:hypothetical protein